MVPEQEHTTHVHDGMLQHLLLGRFHEFEGVIGHHLLQRIQTHLKLNQQFPDSTIASSNVFWSTTTVNRPWPAHNAGKMEVRVWVNCQQSNSPSSISLGCLHQGNTESFDALTVAVFWGNQFSHGLTSALQLVSLKLSWLWKTGATNGC